MAVPRLVGGLVALVVLAGCGGGDPSAASPSPRPSEATDPGSVFEGLPKSAFDDTGAPTTDGRRVLDVLALQGALLRYRFAHQAYPSTLTDLQPELVATVPRDPATGADYAYAAVDAGASYELKAVLSNGREFAGATHREP